MKKVLDQLSKVAKAVAAAVLPLVSVALLNGAFNYKAIVAAAVTAIMVFLVPNKAASA